MINEAWQGMEGRRQKVDQVKENSARPARLLARYTTTGLGVLAEETVFDFGMAFIDMPIFNFGAAVGQDSDLPDATADFPNYLAGVYKWKLTGDGLYTGAWCWFSVSAGGSVNAATFSMDFLLSWAGVASKNFIASPGFPVSELEL